MQSTTNAFLDGISTDLHPLTIKNTQLTDALNAAIVTGNGNEMILQNDMGNTLIEDSRTGNIIGLSDGFIPVGIREYGGILYIASYNKDEDKGELGTIPSPLITYQQKSPISKNNLNNTLADTNDPDINIQNHINQNLILVTKSGDKLKAGDKFMISLDIDNLYNIITRLDAHFITNNNYINSIEKTYPMFTHYEEINEEIVKVYGYYRIDLYARLSSGKDVKLNTDFRQLYYTVLDPEIQTSEFWFIDQNNFILLDEERNSVDLLYFIYPNIPSGHLAIKIELEIPEDISILERTDFSGVKAPFTYIVLDAHTVSRSALDKPVPGLSDALIINYDTGAQINPSIDYLN